jgi:hypothetical protein
LIDNENITPEKIVVATGAQRELDAINLFDPACPVEFIITVEALKEGWDCSFAYILCSVANISSATDIEQLLGRILRMPYAKTRTNAALNCAYTHVSSPRFGEGARALTDTLVQKMGFEPDEASTSLQLRLPGFDDFGSTNGDLFNRTPVLLETVDTEPDLTGLAPDVAERVQVEKRQDGTFTVTVKGEISDELEKRLVAATTPDRNDSFRASVDRHRIMHGRSIAPVARGEKFAAPVENAGGSLSAKAVDVANRKAPKGDGTSYDSRKIAKMARVYEIRSSEGIGKTEGEFRIWPSRSLGDGKVLGTRFPTDEVEALDHLGYGLIPGDSLPLILPAYSRSSEGVLQPIRMVKRLGCGCTLRADESPAGRALRVPGDLHHLLSFHTHQNLTDTMAATAR